MRGAALAVLVPLYGASSDARSYLPPGEPGYIYTVVTHPPATSAPTTITARWGGWQQTGQFTPSSRGVVLRLRHAKWDRVLLTVRTNGRIISGPVQGSAPGEWTDPRFERAIW